MVLQIGLFDTGFAANKAARFKVVGRTQSAAKQDPFDADLEFGQRAHGRIQGDGLGAGVLHIGFQVVLQVFAYAAQRCDHVQAKGLQFSRVANARELQELRRIDGATRQNHLAPGAELLRLAVV